MPRVGDQRIVVLTVNRLLQVLSSTTGVLVTGTSGPRSTHIPLTGDAGLTRYGESYAVATELHSVSLVALRRQRGRLSSGDCGCWRMPCVSRTASPRSTCRGPHVGGPCPAGPAQATPSTSTSYRAVRASAVATVRSCRCAWATRSRSMRSRCSGGSRPVLPEGLGRWVGERGGGRVEPLRAGGDPEEHVCVQEQSPGAGRQGDRFPGGRSLPGRRAAQRRTGPGWTTYPTPPNRGHTVPGSPFRPDHTCVGCA